MAFDYPEFKFASTIWEVLLNAGLVAVGRFLDLLSTYYVTRQLTLETNKRVQKLGWRGAILLQLPSIIMGALNLYVAFFIMIWSIFVASSNLEGSYYIRDKGEESYYQELQELVRRTSWHKLILGETNLLGSIVVAGVLLLVFLGLQDGLGILLVAIALICHGILKTVRSLEYLRTLRKTPEKNTKSAPAVEEEKIT